MAKLNPLQTGRFYKFKKVEKKFLCALCSAPREMRYSKHLKSANYLQIILISIALSWIFFPIIGAEAVFAVFLIWPVFEVTNKILYRKEIPCSYCGFDATWYRRDVKVANQKVKEFWLKNHPELVDPSKNIKNIDNIVGQSQTADPDTLDSYSAH